MIELLKKLRHHLNKALAGYPIKLVGVEVPTVRAVKEIYDAITLTLIDLEAEKAAKVQAPPPPSWQTVIDKDKEIDRLKVELRKAKGFTQRCGATLGTDPPQDCDAPFCGCHPEWETALTGAKEAGWLTDREASALRLELANAIKANAAQAVILNDHAQIILTLKTECGFWRRHEAAARTMYNDLVNRITHASTPIPAPNIPADLMTNDAITKLAKDIGHE